MSEFIDINNLNYLDITIITLVLILSIKGFVNGFLRELFGLIGLIGGIIVASNEFKFVGENIYNRVYPLENIALLNLISFIIIIISIWIVSSIIGIVISTKAHKYRKIGLISRVLGLLMSGGKYFLLFATIFISLFNVPFIKDNLLDKIDINNSKVYPFLNKYGNLVINLDEMKKLNIKSKDFLLTKLKEKEVVRLDNNDTNKSIEIKKPTINSIIVKEKDK
ncbi:Putative integral membrane protein [hydrothermal vent metagenome]|uniref:Putative integral membrane protein n=1 Tax=hydrothermal vent metagenome TaxID=652676 RepID=A0A1W1EJJ5_9ZZZZ